PGGGLRSLAMNSAGQFVVTYSYGNSTYAQVYTSTGSPNGSAGTGTRYPTISGTITTGLDAARPPTLSCAPAGPSGYFYYAGNVHYLQLKAGQLTPESIANTTTAGAQNAAGIAATGKGFVIAWVGNGAFDPNGIYLQRFAPASQVGSFAASASTV